MENDAEYIELVKKAQKGDRDSLNLLAEKVHARLSQYAVRLTLNQDLAQDIVQETILEMYKVFGKLKRADRFWGWIYRIAFNKVRSHYGRQWRHKTTSLSELNSQITKEGASEGLADMISAEWKQIVFESMAQLEPRHRAVLTMRCYDQMSYSEIADFMESSEIGVRALFYRAKKSLAKKLSHYGLGKGAIISALVFFGKFTATSEASAASVAISPATLHVGLAGSLLGIAASKSAIVTMMTAGAMVVGTAVVAPSLDNMFSSDKANYYQYVAEPILQLGQDQNKNQQHWYYYPPGMNGAVLMQTESDSGKGASYYQWFQDEQANFYRINDELYVNNYRNWNPDLSVKLLPTDSERLTSFINRAQKNNKNLDYVPYKEDGLMIILKQAAEGSYQQVVSGKDISNEEFFRCNVPAGIRRIDNRDAMHKRGWAFFTVEGKIGDELVKGKGRTAFVYDVCRSNYPWIKLYVGSKLISESESFGGLSRPWMGLHTIDTVRRDAAKEQIWFETKLLSGGTYAVVTLDHPKGKIEYTIDMEADLVEKVVFLTSDLEKQGELRFNYLQGIEDAEDFTPPAKSLKWLNYNQQSMLWLVELLK
ncbi:MAG TPA: RNA polymerase sigma factor [Sedimentisphaerales bacterium]|nr:RNA polymerase sigma factor [Sedimentisphaerales bacterium]